MILKNIFSRWLMRLIVQKSLNANNTGVYLIKSFSEFSFVVVIFENFACVLLALFVFWIPFTGYCTLFNLFFFPFFENCMLKQRWNFSVTSTTTCYPVKPTFISRSMLTNRTSDAEVARILKLNIRGTFIRLRLQYVQQFQL